MDSQRSSRNSAAFPSSAVAQSSASHSKRRQASLKKAAIDRPLPPLPPNATQTVQTSAPPLTPSASSTLRTPSAPGTSGTSGPPVSHMLPPQRSLRRKNAPPPLFTPRPDQNPSRPLSKIGSKTLVADMAALELGVEFQLDIRQEDLLQLKSLGSGNGGTVSQVMHVPTQKLMARKTIHIEKKPEVRKQIMRELQIMHDCCDNNYIVDFYGAVCLEGDAIICMEYMDCGSLDGIIKVCGKIPEPIIAQVSISVLRGLKYLYNEHRIIHRDVKPSNVLVNSRGEFKISDFGVSRELINSVADTFVGTSTYMSPERIQGAPYTVKSDVWSFGIMLIELAIGCFPFLRYQAETPTPAPAASATSAAHPTSRRKAAVQNPTELPSVNSLSFQGPEGILDLLQRIVNEPPPEIPNTGEFSPCFRAFVATCLLREQQRPTPQELLGDEFILRGIARPADTAAWAAQVKQKLAGNSR